MRENRYQRGRRDARVDPASSKIKFDLSYHSERRTNKRYRDYQVRCTRYQEIYSARRGDHGDMKYGEVLVEVPYSGNVSDS